MLSDFSSAAYTSCARSYFRSIAALVSNVYALRTANLTGKMILERQPIHKPDVRSPVAARRRSYAVSI